MKKIVSLFVYNKNLCSRADPKDYHLSLETISEFSRIAGCKPTCEMSRVLV